MRGKQYLTTPAQFGLVYDRGRSWATDLLVMKALASGLGLSRYGFSISRRVGNAVVRNRVKRRLREIMRQTPLKPGWDVIFIVRPAASVAGYGRLEKAAKALLLRAKLLAEDYEEISVKTD